MHGRIISKQGGMAKIQSILAESRSKDDILLDAGDMFQGSFTSNCTEGMMAVNAFNIMNYDAYVVGNHELEFGYHALRKGLSSINCPVLCANIRFKSPIANVKPYVILKRKGLSIGIIGLGERESRNRMMPQKMMSFLNEERALAEALNELRRKRVDMIILVRHGGIYFSGGSLYTMLKKFPEIDIVIGGHTHQVEVGKKIAGSYYVQPGAYGDGISRIKVEFNDRTRRVERITSAYLKAENKPPASSMSAVLSRERRMNNEGNRSIKHNIPRNMHNIKDVQTMLLFDALNGYINYDACIFFIDESKMRWYGKLSKYMIYRMFPYENKLVTVPVTGQEFRRILEDCRKYAQKYNVKLVVKNSSKDRFWLCTTEFILSGGGRNFISSRMITEKKSGKIKVYKSPRQAVTDHFAAH